MAQLLRARDDSELCQRAVQEGFKPLSKHRPNTFAGDQLSLEVLRRRVERSNFVSTSAPLSTTTKTKAHEPHEYVCIVDAFSTGACIAYEASRRGYGIVHCLSLEPSEELAGMVPSHLRGVLPWATTLYVDTRAKDAAVAAQRLARELVGFVSQEKGTLVAIIPGAETGVKLADFLSAQVSFTNSKILTNGTRLTEARRNKADMGDAVRAAGVRAVRQLRATTWAPVQQWLQSWLAGPSFDEHRACDLIVKPLESAGSDGVTACVAVKDVKAAMEALVGKVNGLGLVNEGVLVQEFLRGTEYVVDGVSRDGEHKVVAVWEYDRRPTNGAGFVLHGQRLLGGGHSVVPLLLPYARSVLDALEVRHGPSHMEVKLTPTTNGATRGDPCLVEVGARCHGAEGFWMSVMDACCGTNQAVAALDAAVDSTRFEALPPLPPSTLRNAGCLKYLIVHAQGTLEAVDENALKAIKALPSYRGHEIFLTVGRAVVPTQNCFSWGGVVKLVNPTDAGLQKDYDAIERLCLNGLWRIV